MEDLKQKNKVEMPRYKVTRLINLNFNGTNLGDCLAKESEYERLINFPERIKFLKVYIVDEECYFVVNVDKIISFGR